MGACTDWGGQMSSEGGVGGATGSPGVRQLLTAGVFDGVFGGVFGAVFMLARVR